MPPVQKGAAQERLRLKQPFPETRLAYIGETWLKIKHRENREQMGIFKYPVGVKWPRGMKIKRSVGDGGYWKREERKTKEKMDRFGYKKTWKRMNWKNWKWITGLMETAKTEASMKFENVEVDAETEEDNTSDFNINAGTWPWKQNKTRKEDKTNKGIHHKRLLLSPPQRVLSTDYQGRSRSRILKGNIGPWL